MTVTITRSVDYQLEIAGNDPAACACQAMADFGAMSPEMRELHAAEIVECWLTTGTLESADCKVFTPKDLERLAKEKS
jgi:hypothetical protein